MIRPVFVIVTLALLVGCGETKPQPPNPYHLAMRERSDCIQYKRQRDSEAGVVLSMMESEKPDRLLTADEASALARYNSDDVCNENLVSAWSRLNPAHGLIWAERTRVRAQVIEDLIARRITVSQADVRFSQLNSYVRNQLKLEDQRINAEAQAERERKWQKLMKSMSDLSCNRAIGGLGCNRTSRPQTPNPLGTNLNRYLVTETPIIGGALCKYSDGTVTRINGSYCPR